MSASRTTPAIPADHASRKPSVDRDFFQAIVDCFHSLNIDFAAACRRHNVVNPLALRGDRLPLEAVSRSYDAVRAEVGTAAFIYPLACAVGTRTMAAKSLADLFLSCTTIGEAIGLMCRYGTVTSDVSRSLIVQNTHSSDLLFIPNRHAYVSPQQMEGTLYIVLDFIRRTQDAKAIQHGIRIEMAHAPLLAPDEYRNLFGCPLRFSQGRYALQIRNTLFNAAIPGGDARKADYQRRLLERHSLALVATEDLPQKIQRIFLQNMGFGGMDREAMARMLAMSVRTMQRELLAAGTSYRELTDAVRLNVARKELEMDEIGLSELTLLLGYTDTRNFRRAFKHWTGTTPAGWRNAASR